MVVFAAFLLGFVPMWLTARTRANERDTAQQSLRMMRIEGALAAAIQARRGDYEPAREAASTLIIRPNPLATALAQSPFLF